MRLHIAHDDIDELNNAVIKNELIETQLDEMRWGFLINPEFSEHGTTLTIIFDLLVPISKTRHILTKSGNKYFLKKINEQNLLENLNTVLELIQVSMEHTRRMFKQKNPEHNEISIAYFESSYFEEELNQQLKDLGLIK